VGSVIKTKSIRRPYLLYVIFLFTLSGCNSAAFLQGGTPISNTGLAELTRSALANTPASPVLTLTPKFGTQAVDQSETTEISGNCNHMAAEIPMDISIPDQSMLKPGERFIKTWRVKNTGSCDWTPEYQLVWISGEDMNPSMPWYLGRTVMPGAAVDIGVEMVAPSSQGDFKSYFKLKDTNGTLFGLGPMDQAPLWVRIQVVDLTIPTKTPLPTITLRPTSAVYRSGLLDLLPADQVDLDQGTINSGAADDLVVDLDDNNQIVVTPLAGASIGFYGVSQPTESGCRLVDLQTSAVIVQQTGTDGYYCYETAQGLPGFIQFVMIIDLNQVQVAYLTWAVP
jgi:hypothetical protein